MLSNLTRWSAKRHSVGGREALRGWALEGLEGRAMLSVAAAAPLLIQVGTYPTFDLASLVAAEGVTLATTGLPGVDKATGADAALTQLAAELVGKPGLGYVERVQTLTVDLTPNDPKFLDGTMWGLNGAHGINAPAAWDVITGSPTVVVADIDTGIDYNHPDLYQNIWINQAEIPASRMKNLTDVFHDGYLSIRDLNDPSNQGPGKITDQNGDGKITAADLLAPMQKDANGVDTGLGGWASGSTQDGDTAHPDDLVGWNFVANTNNPFDDHGHGTHTAGTIAARGNDGNGSVGVMWQAEVMSLKFLDSKGSGSDLGAALATRYAADHGARVSNNSYGGGSGTGSPLADAITYAASKGDVFVAAAGNNSGNNDAPGMATYPANFPNDNIIAVAAIDSAGALANFSNYGATSVDLAAPGVGIYSTLPNNSYGSWSGTSMATPHVTGAIGLLLSAHPGWTYQQLIHQVLSTTTPDPSVAGKTVTGGVLNVGAALAPPAATATATYVSADVATQGNWKGVYGANGVDLNADANTIPAYASLAPINAASYTWDGNSTAVQSLQRAGTGRVAATWYDAAGYTLDLNLTDANAHKVSLYALDYDRNNRSERIDVLDAATGTVLDTRSISGYAGGEYLTWKLSGHVLLRVTNTGPANAVISGLFFDPLAPPANPTATAGYLGTDAATQGNWKGVYGADGADIVADSTATPAYATLTPAGQSTWTWDASPTGLQALQRAGTGRIAATWYASAGYTLDLNLTDANAHKVSLYALDYDRNNRSERIDVLDAATGTVLDTRSISGFAGGQYLSWKLSGHVLLRVTNTGPSNAVISGVFFDPSA